ncbi:ferrous iron transport protein B [Olivibacter domesticus]|uniref:Ferrous iron transport protein B n=1 Tax=Olivibacter domesticus TaxID=407022 RepID=A0A1H7U9Z6_OLID1|nr:ferrous iron transport protein B [Olivibacter domesticus]SEL93584.1 ferrous iron transport protein B [Olivibacter domesticus]
MKIALVGNPNTGKSTLFNSLTGLNQKIGNFPGITVDKKTGHCKLSNGQQVEVIDLPGCYSLYPKSKDEAIVLEVLTNPKNSSYPDLIVVVVDATNLKRNLLLFTQVADLKIPVILALNMTDAARKEKIVVDIDKMSQKLGVQVVPISARKNENIELLKQSIADAPAIALQKESIAVNGIAPELIAQIKNDIKVKQDYVALLLAHQHEILDYLTDDESNHIESLEQVNAFHSEKSQTRETIERYDFISRVLNDTVTQLPKNIADTPTGKIDKFLTHKVWGFVSFIAILLLIFQAIFAWAEYPMGLIENFFAWLDEWGRHYVPEGVLADLIFDGILAGLGGVLVFIPQIAILFGFIAILEDTGYMARITFLMDRIMRKVGLNGKSVVPMIGGLACAVPSIMAARNIESWKDRIITIMVTPLISCAARLPVYTLLISLVVPNDKLWGFFNLQGLALMAMYLIGTIGAVVVAWVMKKIIKSKERSYFILELPVYRTPRWRSVFLTMYEKVKTFVLQVGKVIIAMSIVLWVLATYGPPGRMDAIEEKYQSATYSDKFAPEEIEYMVSSEKLENSYVGILGRTIEPVIRPLGFDWKIGIALITSFAAREVFVGTMATIYSVAEPEEDTSTIRQKMLNARDTITGEPVYTVATAFSLMIFYAFAMQCISTVAVVYRETKSWKWPVIQLSYMTALAYFASLIVYQVLK